MDKARMTFRFDRQGNETRTTESQKELHGQEQVLIDNNQHINQHVVIDRPVSYTALDTSQSWGDPFTDHTGLDMSVYRQEENIEESLPIPVDSKTEYNDAHVPTEDDWYDNYQPVVQAVDKAEDYGNEMYVEHYRYNYKRTSWWKISGSITGAIVTGALFGFVVLSFFKNEVSLPIPGIAVPTQAQNNISNDIPVMGMIDEESVIDHTVVVQLDLPEQRYYFLQYGVFSSAQGVQLAQEELQASGIAAARDLVDEKRVYAGVSPDREQAKLLTGGLKAAGVHLIVHEIALPRSAQLKYDGEIGNLERYISQSADLISLLSSSSAELLGQIKPKALTPEEMEEIGKLHQLWTESAAAIRGKLSGDAGTYANIMEKAMNSAVEAMGEYQKQGVNTLLWEVQSQMMVFILNEQKLVTFKS